MKKLNLTYLTLFLGILFLGSCTKKEDNVAPVTPVVVGTWKSDRIVITELPLDYATINGKSLDPLQTFGLQETYTINADNTFTYKEIQSGVITDYKGTWVFTTNSLKLTYSDKSTEDLNYDESTKFLSTPQTAVKLPLTNPTTKIAESVPCKLQFFYVK
ncbi:MAG: hypothetical protein RLZZ306_3162 [Bacteroidota bacterium]